MSYSHTFHVPGLDENKLLRYKPNDELLKMDMLLFGYCVKNQSGVRVDPRDVIFKFSKTPVLTKNKRLIQRLRLKSKWEL